MKLNNVLANGPISLPALERMFGLGVSEDLEKMAEAGDLAITVNGNYVAKSFLRKGAQVLLPLGVVGRIDSVERDRVRAVPEVYPFNDQLANFNPVKFKISQVRLVLAEDDITHKGRYVITLPGYPSMQIDGDTGLQALTNGIARLMEASSNKKIVFHDEWYGEPQFGALINKLRPNLERYVAAGPEAAHEGLEPKTITPAPAAPVAPAQTPEQLDSGILQDVQKQEFHNSVTEQAADKIINRLVGASFVDWAARHYALSDICRVLSVTLKEAAKTLGREFIKESDKKTLIRSYLMALGDKLGADKMAALWESVAILDRKAAESYVWRVIRGNEQVRAGLQSTETPLVFSVLYQTPEVLKVAYEEVQNRVIQPADLDIEKAASVLKDVFGEQAEEACSINPKLSELAKRAVLDALANDNQDTILEL